MIDYAAVYTALIAWARGSIVADGGEPPPGSAIRIVQANQENVKPALPFLTVLLSALGQTEGLTAVVDGNADGDRVLRYEYGTVSIQGYGLPTRRWLSALLVSLDLDELTAPLAAAGIDLSELGGVSDLSGLLDTSNQPRFSLDLRIRYRQASGRIAAPALAYAQIDPVELTGADPADPLSAAYDLPDPPE